MAKEKLVLFRRILGILLSISIFLAGICFIGGCLSIYGSGESQPYSRDAVAETFGKIAVPVYICIALAVVSIVFELFFPAKKTKTKPSKNYKGLIEHLSGKKDIASNEIVFNMINSERKQRRNELFAVLGILGVTGVIFLFYALDPDNFASGAEITSSVINAMRLLIPLLSVDFTASVIVAYRAEASFARELELIKQLPNVEKNQNSKSSIHSENKIFIIKLSLILVSVAIIVFGYFSGGAADVLTKAINICTECIGLG